MFLGRRVEKHCCTWGTQGRAHRRSAPQTPQRDDMNALARHPRFSAVSTSKREFAIVEAESKPPTSGRVSRAR